MGGYASIAPLVRAGVVKPVEFNPEVDDPWIWIDDAVSGKGTDEKTGLVIFDSGTSQAEALLTATSHASFQIGQQATQKFAVTRVDKNAGIDRTLSVAINNKAHYGVVQGFLLDAIWKSTWLTRRGIDVLWTFSVNRGEEQDGTAILGPKLAGQALTASVPKWFNYTWKLSSIAQADAPPIHRLYLSESPEMGGSGHSFGNSRQPLNSTPLPPYIEPASIIKALELIEASQKEADAFLQAELGL